MLAYVYLTLPDVRVLATRNPTTTAFMQLRADEAAREGRTVRQMQVWVPYARISQNLKRAVLVAEDDAFWEHEGVDLEQLEQSVRINWEKGKAVRGASTITQQLAKNLYLSPSRNPLRKLRELIIARRLEAALPKARIFEIYLNVIEWGDGIWGAEAAARTYFHGSAASLGREQAALLAGAIINPRVLNPARPTQRLIRRQRIVLSRMGEVTPPVPVAVPASAPQEAPGADGEPLPEPGTERDLSQPFSQPSADPAAPAEPPAAPVELPSTDAPPPS